MEFTLKQQVRAALKRRGGSWDDEETIRSCQREAVEICDGSNKLVTRPELNEILNEVCRVEWDG